jgi:cytochrome c-type biogenesis protein CcmE
MNKRARNRLIGVTAIILIIIAAVFFGSMRGGGGPAYYKTVTEIVAQKAKLAGTNVTVGGPVVSGSWDKKTRPMTFAISDETSKSSPATLAVVYQGGVPSTFGDGVVAIVTGKLDANGVVQATDMQTKCPEKNASGRAAIQIAAYSAKLLAGVPVEVAGFVKAGSLVPPGGTGPRFVLQSQSGTATLDVKYDGAPPAGFKDGAQVVVGGSADASGGFSATSVALAK